MKKRKKILFFIPVVVLAVLTAFFLLYAENYYHAEASAQAALKSDETVQISETEYGWYFDGPSEENAFIFYPGAKVEETAYAPLLRRLAAEGLDVCLVKMPFRLAVFGIHRADMVIGLYDDYKHWYVGGHSLGGAMAANYAAEHDSQLTGLILLAAYPSKKLNNTLLEISIYGSEDHVLSLDKVETGKSYAPEAFREYVIDGGNHAQFGNYGRQKGDGTALITDEEQQKLTVSYIIQNL